MYLGYQNGKIKFYTEQPLGPIYNVDKVEETDQEYVLFEGDYVLASEYEELQQQKQKQEILSLYMTRSDFFDGTIKAFGLNQHDLYPIIESVLEGILPEKEGRIWYECDIDYRGGYRNNARLVYSNDGLMFYSEFHEASQVIFIK